jgi:3-phosphoshikimate 1-carboxyvinyltransferase
VEGDWSSASYFYSLAALSDATELTITNLKEKSTQPDSYCVQFFRLLGVETEFKHEQIRLRKTNTPSLSTIEIDCSDCPDLAQALAVVCSAKKIPLRLFGLSTLRMKETDRISALQKELYKFGVLSEAGNDFLFLNPENFSTTNPEIVIDTYDDHRMAMCFAPLAFLRKKLRINNPDVVKKSFPDFWNVLKKIGIQSKRG